jgi:nucleoside-diphosphate-sugar epimerase
LSWRFLRMRTLVTGAAGFIGSTLVDRLLEFHWFC